MIRGQPCRQVSKKVYKKAIEEVKNDVAAEK